MVSFDYPEADARDRPEWVESGGTAQFVGSRPISGIGQQKARSRKLSFTPRARPSRRRTRSNGIRFQPKSDLKLTAL
jgi:hypothetical protein